MKRIAFVIVIILLLSCFVFAYADTDITFQRIPWLSDDTVVIKTLSDAGLIRNDAKISYADGSNATYLVLCDDDLVIPDKNQEYKDVCKLVKIEETRGRIAGCPLDDLELSFAFDGDYKLIAIKVRLINCTFELLKQKISRVYGDCQETITEEFVESYVWKGENNSAILLYTDCGGQEYTLMYGRLDSADILSKCLGPADPDDVFGL